MPLTATPATQPYMPEIAFLHTTVAYTDNGTAKTVGVLPAGAIIVKAVSGAYVTEVFNAGTTNVLDIGTSANDDLYGTDLALTATNFVAVDEAVNLKVTADTTVTVTVGLAGTAATTGAADIVIGFILP